MEWTKDKPTKEGYYWAKWLYGNGDNSEYESTPQVVAVSMSYLNMKEQGLNITYFGGDFDMVSDCDYMWSKEPIEALEQSPKPVGLLYKNADKETSGLIDEFLNIYADSKSPLIGDIFYDFAVKARENQIQRGRNDDALCELRTEQGKPREGKKL